MTNSNVIKKFFSITKEQEFKLQGLIEEITAFNKHTNIVGKSTLHNPWKSHILDCIQISPLIRKKNSSILDMGTGAGLPGLVLSIMGFSKVSLVDSNAKKINFIKSFNKKFALNTSVFLSRIEKLNKKPYDYLTARALAKLNNLFSYSHNFISKDTVLIFLKGKTVNDEIVEAKKNWSFDSEIKPSKSDIRGKVLIVKRLVLKK